MTTKQIEAAQKRGNVKFEVAKQIRQLLDEAKKTHGFTSDEWPDVEGEIVELVTGE
jgi:hypothetical protein